MPPDQLLPSPADTVGAQPDEDPKTRVDRELRELLEEIRVVLPGIELLFGFLLILPFTETFGSLSALGRGTYVACLLVTAAATALLISPSARHRIGFRDVDKELLVFSANRQVIAALILVGIAVALAVQLVVSTVFGSVWASLAASAVAAWFAGWWFVHPRRSRKVIEAAR
jgi:hypothetical protein